MNETFPQGYLYLAAMFPQVSFMLNLKDTLSLTKNTKIGVGDITVVNKDTQIFDNHILDNTSAYLFQLGGAILFFLLFSYFDQIIVGENGIPRSPFFPFFDFRKWCRRCRNRTRRRVLPPNYGYNENILQGTVETDIESDSLMEISRGSTKNPKVIFS